MIFKVFFGNAVVAEQCAAADALPVDTDIIQKVMPCPIGICFAVFLLVDTLLVG